MTPEEKKAFLARIKKVENSPWELRQEPFRVVGNIYYVGNKYVAYYLIKGEDRTALIDCGPRNYLYQLIDSLWRIGVKPEEVTDLLVTHGHFDHCGCVRQFAELSGCKCWFPKGDAFFLTERRDLIAHPEEVAEFTVDEYYNYDAEPLDFGGTKVKPLFTPGHTPGTTSFLITTTENGKEYNCAIMGGLGLNGLEKFELREKGLPESLQQDYLNGLQMLDSLDVDINLPSHPHAAPAFLEFVGQDADAFADPRKWHDMLAPKIAAIQRMIKEDKQG